MSLIRSVIGVGCAAAAGLLAQPAYADDWQSLCKFEEAGLSMVVSYHAGDPSYDVLVTVSGTSELGRGRKIIMNVLQTPDDTALISKWDEDLQIILRVTKDDQATATIEIGSGVSWDYKRLTGSCEAL